MINNKINPVNGGGNDERTPEEKILFLEKRVKTLEGIIKELSESRDDRFLYSQSWFTLTETDKLIYFICKTFARTEENKNVIKKYKWKADKDCFVFAKVNYQKYNLSSITVGNSIKRLREHGFIDVVPPEERGGKKEKRNLYRFSEEWLKYESETKESREILSRIYGIMSLVDIKEKDIAIELGVSLETVQKWWRLPSYFKAKSIEREFKKLLDIYIHNGEIDTKEEDYMTNFYEETYEKIKEGE